MPKRLMPISNFGAMSDCALPAVVIRSGALGDFILTLPLLKACRDTGAPLHLVTRKTWYSLIPEELRDIHLYDIDSHLFSSIYADAVDPTALSLPSFFQGARIFSFLKPDPIFECNAKGAGARSVTWIQPKPDGPEHAVRSFLKDAGFDPGRFDIDRPLYSGKCHGNSLWIHPGSGSRAKNCPPDHFAEFAVDWQNRNGGMVFCSFGEADLHLVDEMESILRRKKVPFRFVITPSLPDLVRSLRENAAFYVGNDSGVSHLASAMGIPSIVLFRSTDPVVWRPIGACTPLKQHS